jgi:hypothetical protein
MSESCDSKGMIISAKFNLNESRAEPVSNRGSLSACKFYGQNDLMSRGSGSKAPALVFTS